MGIDRYGLERTVEGRWFALADFTAAVIAAILLYFVPALRGWPLLLAVAPWLARLSASKFPFRRTIFDIPLGIFMVTAFIGVWAAYDQELAWTKFWILASAVLLYYSVAGQPAENLWHIGAFFVGLGVFAAGFFLIGHDWIAEPLKIGVFNRLGEAWMDIRPNLRVDTLHPNSTGTFIAMFSPFAVAIAMRNWRERRLIRTALSLGALVLMATALIMTTSRGAWLGLTVAASLWVLWIIVGRVSPALRISKTRGFTVLVATMLALGVVTIASIPSGVEILAESLPGPSVASSRLELVRSGIALAGEFPFTGSGLGSFPGLFSQYYRVVPFFLLGHSHNLFLDVSVEQGIVGALSLLVIMVGSFATMFLALPKMSHEYSLLLGAALVGLVAVLVHGLVDDPLYGLVATPMLFLMPGFGVALIGLVQEPQRIAKSSRIFKPGKPGRVWIAGALTIVFLVAIPTVSNVRESFLATWFANIGSIEMAKVELAEWPTGAWDDGNKSVELARADSLFSMALRSDPINRTANHRLGLIRMLERDYEGAIGHLELASAQDPEHRGIQKALGQSYAWAGELDNSVSLLSALPESRSEMSVYQWWWAAQGHEDLALNATAMSELLDSATN